MAAKDPRIDAYIKKACPFAQPILNHLRAQIHAACPAVEETMKWGMPFFMYRGVLCHMAAFKEHCAFGFWRDLPVLGDRAVDGAAGQLGRIASMKDLPSPRELSGYIKAAVKLRDQPDKAPGRRPPAKTKPDLALPEDLGAALAKSSAAKKNFAEFSPSCRREYIEWITEAKRAETRVRRIETAVEWIAKGKSRNWKYE